MNREQLDHAGVDSMKKIKLDGKVGLRMNPQQLHYTTVDHMKKIKLEAKAERADPAASTEFAMVPYKSTGLQRPKQIYCQICRDVASGIHYGVYSCEGCKAFFRRSMSVTTNYVCPSSNTCNVDVLRRKSCKSCRLQKCFDMGMIKHAGRLFQGDILTTMKRINLQPLEKAVPSRTQVVAMRAPLWGSLYDGALPPVALCLRLLEIEVPIRKSYHDNSQEDTELNLMTSLVRLADRELLDIVHWAKCLPGFIRLNITDQARAIEFGWMDILVIGVCFRSRACAGKLMYFAPDLILDSHRAEIAGMTAVVKRLRAISIGFHRLGISREEFVLLRFLVLLNSDVDLLNENRAVRMIHSYVLQAMESTVSTQGGSRSQRMAELIELIAHIRHASIYATTHLFELKEDQACPIGTLVRSLLGTKSNPGP